MEALSGDGFSEGRYGDGVIRHAERRRWPRVGRQKRGFELLEDALGRSRRSRRQSSRRSLRRRVERLARANHQDQLARIGRFTCGCSPLA